MFIPHTLPAMVYIVAVSNFDAVPLCLVSVLGKKMTNCMLYRTAFLICSVFVVVSLKASVLLLCSIT